MDVVLLNYKRMLQREKKRRGWLEVDSHRWRHYPRRDLSDARTGNVLQLTYAGHPNSRIMYIHKWRGACYRATRTSFVLTIRLLIFLLSVQTLIQFVKYYFTLKNHPQYLNSFSSFLTSEYACFSSTRFSR